MTALLRIEAQIAAFEAALARGRVHHAWLLAGPEGVGKAGFAWRAAARLLGAHDFDPAAEDPALRLMTAGAHPDFLSIALEARERGGGMRREITVDQARRLPEFFAKAPAIAPYRVAVIDAADDLNTNAANAVLKTLEEPSGRGVVFLVSHAPGRLLPTIRSRCRRLVFQPWPEAAVASWLAGRGVADADTLAGMSGGSPGRALALGDAGAVEVDTQARALILASARQRPALIQPLVDGLRGEEGRARFALAIDRLAAHAAARAGEPEAGGASGAGWAEAWTRLSSLVDMVDGLNLDRADALAAALQALDRAAC